MSIARPLSKSEINHLRKLLGWVNCEIGQSPDEMISTVKSLAPAIQDISEEGKRRLVESHTKSANVPKYIRQAVKALRKTIKKQDGEIVDVDSAQTVGTDTILTHAGAIALRLVNGGAHG